MSPNEMAALLATILSFLPCDVTPFFPLARLILAAAWSLLPSLLHYVGMILSSGRGRRVRGRVPGHS